jgi:hypothetical protein
MVNLQEMLRRLGASVDGLIQQNQERDQLNQARDQEFAEFKADVARFVQESRAQPRDNQPPPNPNPPAAPVPPGAPADRTFDPVNDQKAFSALLRSLSKYDPTKMRWPMFRRVFEMACRAQGFCQSIQGIDQKLKYALYHCLDMKAVQMVGEAFVLDRGTEVDELSYTQYADKMGQLFCPEAGTVATREDFYARKQGRNEPYLLYLQDKLELFNLGWNGKEDFPTLKFETIKGLANFGVRNELYVRDINDWPSLSRAVEQLVIGRRHQIKAGDTLSDASMDGLAASTEIVDKSKSSYSADVNQITPPTAAPSADKPCWDCGSPDHFHNSPRCKEVGARKFWPARGRGRGGRGQGGRGQGGRGAGGRGSSGSSRGYWVKRRGFVRSNTGSVNQLETEQDVWVKVEDATVAQDEDFLEEASPTTTTT